MLCCCYCCYVAGNREKSSQGTTGKLQDNSNLWPNLQPVSSPRDIDNIKLMITLLVSKWFCILFPSTRLSTEQQKYIKVHTLSYFIDTVQNCSQIFSPSAGCIAGCSSVVVFHCCQSPSPEIQHQTQQVSSNPEDQLANTACKVTCMVSNIHAPHVMLQRSKANMWVFKAFSPFLSTNRGQWSSASYAGSAEMICIMVTSFYSLGSVMQTHSYGMRNTQGHLPPPRLQACVEVASIFHMFFLIFGAWVSGTHLSTAPVRQSFC